MLSFLFTTLLWVKFAVELYLWFQNCGILYYDHLVLDVLFCFDILVAENSLITFSTELRMGWIGNLYFCSIGFIYATFYIYIPELKNLTCHPFNQNHSSSFLSMGAWRSTFRPPSLKRLIIGPILELHAKNSNLRMIMPEIGQNTK